MSELHTAVYKQMLIFTYMVISSLAAIMGSSLDCHALNIMLVELEYCPL